MLIFLGIPLLAGYLTRRLGERAKGRDWYEERFLPRLGPFALYGLLITIVILFALQGDRITSQPLDVARIALPLLAYFMIMWAGSFMLGKGLGPTYQRSVTLAFTAAGNNFELAIAVAIATFGITSGEALAGVVGPSSRSRCWSASCGSPGTPDLCSPSPSRHRRDHHDHTHPPRPARPR